MTGDAPHNVNYEQRGSWGEQTCGMLERPLSIMVDYSLSVEALVSTALSFYYSDRIVKATASAEVNIDGRRHFLVPLHVFQHPHPSLATETGATEDSENERFDFSDFMEEEARSDIVIG
jgi:hypothetical protein